jgi:hypothetical protein
MTTTGPSTQEINEMQKLIMLMNGEDSSPSPIMEQAPQAPRYTPSSNADVSAMKSILESFYGAAEDALTETFEVSNYDPKLKEALHTKKTNEGVMIGRWEVRVKLVESQSRNQKPRKHYDVLNPATGETMFSELVIFEAAHAIVRYLNKGLTAEHPKIQEIADLEEIYRRNRQDAMIFKKRFERCQELKEMAAGEVFEARHQKARAQAIVANDSIKTILDNIR